MTDERHIVTVPQFVEALQFCTALAEKVKALPEKFPEVKWDDRNANDGTYAGPVTEHLFGDVAGTLAAYSAIASANLALSVLLNMTKLALRVQRPGHIVRMREA